MEQEKIKTKQIKRDKISSAIEKGGFKVTNWYIVENAVKYVKIVHAISKIEFICFIPDSFLLNSDEGQYLIETPKSTNIEQALQMWSEFKLSDYVLYTNDNLIIKTVDSIDTYKISQVRPSKNPEMDMINKYEYKFEMAEESEEKKDVATVNGPIILHKNNPFSIFNEPEKIQEVKTIENCQPSLLVNYTGFTYGQCFPLYSIIKFINDIQNKSVQLSADTNQIVTYQNLKMEQSFLSASTLIDRFTTRIKESQKKWKEDFDENNNFLLRIQTILEKSKGRGDQKELEKKANHQLKQAMERMIEKRDTILGFLTVVNETFSQI